MMASKKLGRIKKFFGKIGVWLYYKTSKKFNLLSLSLLYKTIIDYLAVINDNDYQEALRVLKENIVSPEGFSYLYNLMSRKIGGISLENFMSEDIEDLPYLITLIFYAVIGPYSKKILGPPIGEFNENGTYVIKTPMKKCFMCMNNLDIARNNLGDAEYGNALQVLMKNLNDMIFEFVKDENPYLVEVRETKCILRGDPYGEFTIWYHQK